MRRIIESSCRFGPVLAKSSQPELPEPDLRPLTVNSIQSSTVRVPQTSISSKSNRAQQAIDDSGLDVLELLLWIMHGCTDLYIELHRKGDLPDIKHRDDTRLTPLPSELSSMALYSGDL
jgi:hypothetical protein